MHLADDPIGLFVRASGEASRALWLRPSSNQALVSLGSAWSFAGGGAERFALAADAWRQLVADALVEGASPAAGPRLLGGFSFDVDLRSGPGYGSDAAPAIDDASLWAGFPSGQLTLPERLFTFTADEAWLTTNRVADPRQQLASTHRQSDAAVQLPRDPAEPHLGLEPVAWQGLVGAVAGRIREHPRLRKVVLARACQAQPTRTLEDALRTLAADYPSCAIFAFAHGDACFLGATPERLIALNDGVATTMALAGSAPRGATPQEDHALAERLRTDPKELGEHAVVVAEVRDGLAQVCTRVMLDAQPCIEKLSNVQHLFTSIRAEVRPGHTILDLVERLHPTPAVGGFPRVDALDVIRRDEGLDRGWYAGPIGWVDAEGNGEFVVGLRSALVRGSTATLFAGCGIVADSQPATEYAEWGWKLRPMLNALGVGA
jgi:isochorismate synthase